MILIATVEIQEWALRTVLAGGIVLTLSILLRGWLSNPTDRLRVAFWCVITLLIIPVCALLPRWFTLAGDPYSATAKTDNYLNEDKFVDSSATEVDLARETSSGSMANAGGSQPVLITSDDYLNIIRPSEWIENTINKLTADSSELAANSEAVREHKWLYYFGIAYIAGAGLFLIWFMIGQIGLYRWWKQARKLSADRDELWKALIPEDKKRLRERLQIRVSQRISSPICFGLWQPKILLPIELNNQLGTTAYEEQLRWVICHECHHLHSGDIRFMWLLGLSQSFYYCWLRLFSIFRKGIELDQELVADRSTIIQTHTHEKGNVLEYASFLLRMATRPVMATGVVGMASVPSQLSRRIDMLLNTPPTMMQGSGRPSRFCRYFCAPLFLLLAMFLGSFRFTQSEASAQTNKPVQFSGRIELAVEESAQSKMAHQVMEVYFHELLKDFAKVIQQKEKDKSSKVDLATAKKKLEEYQKLLKNQKNVSILQLAQGIVEIENSRKKIKGDANVFYMTFQMQSDKNELVNRIKQLEAEMQKINSAMAQLQSAKDTDVKDILLILEKKRTKLQMEINTLKSKSASPKNNQSKGIFIQQDIFETQAELFLGDIVSDDKNNPAKKNNDSQWKLKFFPTIIKTPENQASSDKKSMLKDNLFFYMEVPEPDKNKSGNTFYFKAVSNKEALAHLQLLKTRIATLEQHVKTSEAHIDQIAQTIAGLKRYHSSDAIAKQIAQQVQSLENTRLKMLEEVKAKAEEIKKLRMRLLSSRQDSVTDWVVIDAPLITAYTPSLHISQLGTNETKLIEKKLAAICKLRAAHAIGEIEFLEGQVDLAKKLHSILQNLHPIKRDLILMKEIDEVISSEELKKNDFKVLSVLLKKQACMACHGPAERNQTKWNLKSDKENTTIKSSTTYTTISDKNGTVTVTQEEKNPIAIRVTNPGQSPRMPPLREAPTSNTPPLPPTAAPVPEAPGSVPTIRVIPSPGTPSISLTPDPLPGVPGSATKSPPPLLPPTNTVPTGVIGVDFSIDSNFIPTQTTDYIKWGMKVEKPISVVAEQFDLKQGKGLVIIQVKPESKAAKAGLKANDIVLRINNKEVISEPKSFQALVDQASGKKIVIQLIRKGKTVKVECKP